MKPLIIIFTLIIILIVGGCITLYSLEIEAQRLDDSLSALEADITKQNWDIAAPKLEEFHEKWDKTSSLWSMLIDHYEIDNIELLLSQLVSYAETRDKNEALSKLSALRTLIKHIPAKEAFNFRNIL